MSNHSSPGRQGASPQVDESSLPTGQCRYILTHPDIKGSRCACVNFTHNKTVPGSSCDCGHLACFHMMVTDPVTDSQELVQLKQRVQEMEQDRRELRQQLAFVMGRLDQNQEIVVRVSQLEEVVDRSKEEAQNEIKAAFRNIKRSWDSITELERRHTLQDERLRVMDRTFAAVATELQSLGRKQMELVETDINLEVRLDRLSSELEDTEEPPTHGRRRRRSSDSSDDRPFHPARRRHSSEGTATQAPTSAPAAMALRPLRPAAAEDLWTVHISLLPTHSQPMPFEKDTSAYNRCLSRGLHRTVVINGLDAESFLAAVSETFGSLLKGRPWMPLQAQSCTAEQLTGLPMLRQLDPSLVHGRYDVDFLRKHCAVCDVSGKIESLYIAMTHESLTWQDLRSSSVYQPGLEASWEYDERFDASEALDDDDGDGMDDNPPPRPSAGDILQALPSSLKRAASEMSRSSSFGSAAATAPEGEGPRAKAPRVLPFPNVEVRRGVKTS